MRLLNEVIQIIEDNELSKKYNLGQIGLFGSILYSDTPNDIDILVNDYKND